MVRNGILPIETLGQIVLLMIVMAVIAMVMILPLATDVGGTFLNQLDGAVKSATKAIMDFDLPTINFGNNNNNGNTGAGGSNGCNIDNSKGDKFGAPGLKVTEYAFKIDDNNQKHLSFNLHLQNTGATRHLYLEIFDESGNIALRSPAPVHINGDSTKIKCRTNSKPLYTFSTSAVEDGATSGGLARAGDYANYNDYPPKLDLRHFDDGMTIRLMEYPGEGNPLANSQEIGIWTVEGSEVEDCISCEEISEDAMAVLYPAENQQSGRVDVKYVVEQNISDLTTIPIDVPDRDGEYWSSWTKSVQVVNADTVRLYARKNLDDRGKTITATTDIDAVAMDQVRSIAVFGDEYSGEQGGEDKSTAPDPQIMGACTEKNHQHGTADELRIDVVFNVTTEGEYRATIPADSLKNCGKSIELPCTEGHGCEVVNFQPVTQLGPATFDYGSGGNDWRKYACFEDGFDIELYDHTGKQDSLSVLGGAVSDTDGKQKCVCAEQFTEWCGGDDSSGNP